MPEGMTSPPRRSARTPASARPKPGQAVGNGHVQDMDGGSIDRETALPVSLLRAREAVMTHMRPILRSHGFTEQQWRVLRKLDRSNPIDKTLLAARSTLLMPSLLRILKDLRDLGLIELVASAQSARLVRVTLSADGERAVRRTSAAIDAASKLVRKRIGSRNIDQLLDLLHMVESRLSNFDLNRG